MKTTLTEAHVAGAQYICAQNGHVAFKPVLRRDLMRAVSAASKAMTLKTSDVVVIDTLLSFLPCRDTKTKVDLPITADMVLVVYASNETICGRAKGMDERTLRRHLKRLCDLGLLRRKDSATGKRFPIKRNGKVVDAFGIDIGPLLQNAANIIDLAHKVDAEAEEIRGLRAQALAVRAHLLRQTDDLGQSALKLVEDAKKLLRRASLTLAGVKIILNELLQFTGEVPCPTSVSAGDNVQTDETYFGHDQHEVPVVPSTEIDPEETEEMAATDGQFDRQVESQKIYTIKRATLKKINPMNLWSTCVNIVAFFPEEPRSEAMLKQTIYHAGSIAAVKERTMADAIHSIGWSRMLQAIDYLIGNAHRIKNPDSYMRNIIDDQTANRDQMVS
jgi:replication initiation protein RepC